MLQRRIAIDSTLLVLAVVCWLLSELRCSGIVRILYRMKALALLAFLVIRAVRHFLDYRAKKPIYQFFELFQSLKLLGSGSVSDFFADESESVVTRSLAQLGLSCSFAVESASLLLNESLTWLLAHELFLCICHVKIRQPSVKRLLKRVALLAVVFLAVNASLAVVRNQFTSHNKAFIIFLNVFPVQTSLRAVLAFLILYYSFHVLVTLRGSGHFREQSQAGNQQHASYASLLVASLAGVQLVKLALPIAHTVYTSLMIQRHFHCMVAGENPVFQCFDQISAALSHGEFFSTGNVFALEYIFIVVRMIRDWKAKSDLD